MADNGGREETLVEPEKLYYFLINNSEKIIEMAAYFEEVIMETEKPQAFVVTLWCWENVYTNDCVELY